VDELGMIITHREAQQIGNGRSVWDAMCDTTL
jgi:hypothetical protein